MFKAILILLLSPIAWGVFAYYTLRMNCDGQIVSMMGIMGYDYLSCQNIFNWPAIIFGVFLLILNIRNFRSCIKESK